MTTLQRTINVLALIIVIWQTIAIITPTTADTTSATGAAVCFYPATAKRLEPGVFSFSTTDPTQTMYLQITGTKRGIITRNDGGYNNATLNRLFPSMTK